MATNTHRLILFTLLVLSTLAAAPAQAQDDSHFQIEAFASLLFEDDFDESDFGLRGAYRANSRWSFESRITRIGGTSLDIYFVDASARYHYDLRGRSHWYVIAGPSKVVQDFEDVFENDLFVHVGFGTEIELTPNLYLRPEILARTSEEFESLSGDLSLGIGWKF